MKQVLSLSVVALVSAAAFAFDYDSSSTLTAGSIQDTRASTVIFGGGPSYNADRFMPWLLADFDALMNNATIGRNEANAIMGGVSTFSSQGNPQFVAYFGTVDIQCSGSGPFVSNNVVVDEFPYADGRSNTIGNQLKDGRLVYRANFDSAPVLQNNYQFVDAGVCPQLAIAPQDGTNILTGVGSGDFLSTPAALENGQGFWVAGTNFAGTGGTVPTGTNIWNYQGAALPVAAPNFSYAQGAVGTFLGIPTGDTRQTAPILMSIGDCQNANRNYVIFGVGNTNQPFNNGNATGGSGGRRPLFLVADEFQVNTSLADAAVLPAPAGEFFVDHAATGGSAEPFFNKRFDINAAGTLVVVTQRYGIPASDLTLSRYSIRLYQGCFDAAGKLTGWQEDPRSPIADAGPGDVVANDGLVGGFTFDAISGVGINDAGNVAFTANYMGEDPNNPGMMIPRTAVYFWENTTSTLHQIAVEDEVVGAGSTQTLGLMPQGTTGTGSGSSDSFASPGLSNDENLMAVLFRNNNNSPDPVRGVLVLDIDAPFVKQCPTCGISDCPADLTGDGQINQNDLNVLLANFNSGPGGDIDGDGDTDQGDLNLLLASFGTACP